MRLRDYRNTRGRFYEENHLEEWVSRRPDAIFPARQSLVLASQNYYRLGEPADLLVLDDCYAFHVVEMKINRVAENGGVAPYQIHKCQMQRYVRFFQWYLRPFPESFQQDYYKFTERFLGHPHSLDADLAATFGVAYCQAGFSESPVRQIYLTEGYDDYAVDYFQDQQEVADGHVRLVYYRFYPGADGDYLEFWEIPLRAKGEGDEAATLPTHLKSADSSACPLCGVDASRICLDNECAIALQDGTSTPQEHVLVIPKKHVASVFDLIEEEQAALWRLVAEVRSQVTQRFASTTLNIRIDESQAVTHAQVRLTLQTSGGVSNLRSPAALQAETMDNPEASRGDLVSPLVLDKESHAFDVCKNRQKLWAEKFGLHLIGSAGVRGDPAYTETLDENLFEPLSSEARRELEQGDGGELVAKGGPPKIHAVHSSAALTCNLFHHWRHQPNIQPLLTALRLPVQDVLTIQFEAKRPIMDAPNRSVYRIDPNLDIAMPCDGTGRFRELAIECKFTEPYRECKPEKKGLPLPYLRDEHLWDGLPNCRLLGRKLSPRDETFTRLHAAQLLKHILGLKHANGKDGFCLVYLWYDAPTREAAQHRDEIKDVSRVICADGIDFRAITFQEVIAALSSSREGHEAYVDYLVNRYL